MGDRYYVDVKCPKCGDIHENWYYAPTSDLGMHIDCGCGNTISLEEYTGISYEDASNLDAIKDLVRRHQ